MKRFIPFFIFLFLFSSQISWAQCNHSVSVSPDTTFCDSISVQLNTIITGTVPSNATYSWLPTTGLDDPNSPNPIASVSNTTTYTYQIASPDTTNQITNGDFENGNTGFTTGYIPGPGGGSGPITFAGTYLVTDDPNSGHSSYSSCNDHTPYAGTNMMVLNGAVFSNTNVWCQTISVTPNTVYNFEMWATSVTVNNTAVLQAQFNGSQSGADFVLSQSLCNWQQFTASWNSGTNTSLTLCIRNTTLSSGGNDFAIDDIRLLSNCVKSGSVTLTSGSNGTTQVQETLCVGDSIMVGGAFQFANGIFTDTLTSFFGCDSVIITDVKFEEATKPQLGVDTTLCGNEPMTIFTNISSVNYTWNTGNATDSITITTAGEYILEITDNNGCSKSDTIQIDYNEYPVVQLGNDTTLCLDENLTLQADQTFSGATYLWQDGETTSTYDVSAPSSTYNLTVANGDCQTSDEIVVTYQACQCRVGVPNVFTPNDDGTNDRIELKVKNGCEFQSYLFQVYTRWGELVYSSTNLNAGWDGRFDGQKLPQDSYIWVLDYELIPRFEEAPVRKSGTLLLVR